MIEISLEINYIKNNGNENSNSLLPNCFTTIYAFQVI